VCVAAHVDVDVSKVNLRHLVCIIVLCVSSCCVCVLCVDVVVLMLLCMLILSYLLILLCVLIMSARQVKFNYRVRIIILCVSSRCVR